MNKYKVGDKVKCICDASGNVPLGTTGTITDDSCAPFVLWDADLPRSAVSQPENVWAVPEEDIELIEENEE